MEMYFYIISLRAKLHDRKTLHSYEHVASFIVTSFIRTSVYCLCSAFYKGKYKTKRIEINGLLTRQ